MRIGFDVTPALVSHAGVARYTWALRDALGARDDVELVQVAPHRTGSRILDGLNRELAWYPYGLGRATRAGSVDVVHCPSAVGARGLRSPLVMTVHDALPWRYPELFTRINVLHQRLVAASVARH